MDLNEVPHSSEGNTYQTTSSEFLSVSSYPGPSSTSLFGNSYLTIKNDLPERFRFRYLSEDGSHGGVQPIVELLGCNDPSNIHIKASLYTNEEIPRLHTNYLFGNHCDNGVCWMELSEDFTAKFLPLPIIIKKKGKTKHILRDRIQEKYRQEGKNITEEDLNEELKRELKRWDMNSVKFCFEAFYCRDESIPVCEKIFSKPIKFVKGKKTAGKLNITRLSRYSGKASGNEDMILLCDEINKDDIENIDIVFFSLDKEGNEDWKENAEFSPNEIHYQVAIIFHTPAFKENVEKDVFIQIRRNSDRTTSNTVKFHYEPCHELEPELIRQTKKRKIFDSVEDGIVIPQASSSSIGNVDFSNLDAYLEGKSPLSISMLDEEIRELFNANEPTNEFSLELKESLFSPLFPDLPDPVSPDGLIDNLSSLSINEKTREMTLNKSDCSETKLEKILKNSVIKLIKESKKDTFFNFFLTFTSFKDENKNNLLHLFLYEKNENLHLLLKMLKCAPNDLINQVNKMHMTPLLIAVSKKLWRVVRILLKFGADPNIKDKNGNNCVHLAAMFNFPFCMKEVLAPLLGDSKQKYLPDINDLNSDGLAPLHLSTINNSELCTKLLFQAKAVVNITDGKCGKTPLHFAYERSSELVSVLLSQPEINPDAEDYSGNIPSSYLLRMPKNSSSIISEPNKIAPKLSTELQCSVKDEILECGDEKLRISSCEMSDGEKNHINENEDAFCKELDSNGLWEQLALYIMDKKEISTIASVDRNPTQTVLSQLKKRYGDMYEEKLKFILNDPVLKEYSELLHL